ncbi:radical SAM protein [Acetobacteraceae bacterium]|nr:radical SAM protein [Candidatus Parcubacteria bacterium]
MPLDTKHNSVLGGNRAMQDVYSKAKLAFHSAALQSIRSGEQQPPIVVHWFPTNVCNQACVFCTFGSGPDRLRAKILNRRKERWKNQQLADPHAVMPKEKMLETVHCLKEIGVKAIQISGGGEPVAYPFFDEMVSAITAAGMEFGLVTNGTLINHVKAELIGSLGFVWARVSIDAGNQGDYKRVRNVSAGHWSRAWKSVSLLARERVRAGHHPEASVGVGYVVDRDNWGVMLKLCS